MKKTLFTILTLGLAAVMLSSCASKKIDGKGVTLNANKPEIIDYKGQAFGSSIPGWVLDASDGNTKNVANALNLKGKKVWILQNDGDDIDILKLWTDQIDGRAQISSSIEQTVGDLIIAEMNTMQATESEKTKKSDEFSTRMSNITLQGLDKVADYWTRTRTLKTGVKKAKSDSDYNYKFTYLVVFAMDEKQYAAQVDAALKDVDENDEQSVLLRELVSAKLKEKVELYTSN